MRTGTMDCSSFHPQVVRYSYSLWTPSVLHSPAYSHQILQCFYSPRRSSTALHNASADEALSSPTLSPRMINLKSRFCNLAISLVHAIVTTCPNNTRVFSAYFSHWVLLTSDLQTRQATSLIIPQAANIPISSCIIRTSCLRNLGVLRHIDKYTE